MLLFLLFSNIYSDAGFKKTGAEFKYNIWTAYLVWRGLCCLCHMTWAGRSEPPRSKTTTQSACWWTCSRSQDDVISLCACFLTFTMETSIASTDPDTHTHTSLLMGGWHGRARWATSHQLVSVPDESGWIIFGDERTREHLRACTDSGWITNKMKANGGCKHFIWFG